MLGCGPAATYILVQSALHPTEIDKLFSTHHHFDHDIDQPCFPRVWHAYGLRLDRDATLTLQLHRVQVLLMQVTLGDYARAMMRSATVDLPWSTCEKMQKLRMWVCGVGVAGMIQSYRRQISCDCYTGVEPAKTQVL